MASATQLDLHNTSTNTASASADPDVPRSNKRFVPLENNPETMTTLLHALGLSPALSFQDVYSISDPSLLSFVPRPAHALLLVFPVSDTYERFRVEEDAGREVYEGKGEGEEVVWFRQTIGNACGLMGVLHAACNGGARGFIESGSVLSQLLQSAIPLGPNDRAHLLEESKALEAAHATAAAGGDTAAPNADDIVELHYVCFLVQDGKLWELDGRRKGPLDRGIVGKDEDVLGEKALDLGVRAFLKREEEAGVGELRFSLVALAPAFD